MGFKLMARVVGSRAYQGNTRMVWLLLAMRADDETGECWPRITTIAHEANISEAATHRALARLVADGCITRQERKTARGKNMPNLWHMGVAADTHMGVAADTHMGVAADTHAKKPTPQTSANSGAVTTPFYMKTRSENQLENHSLAFDASNAPNPSTNHGSDADAPQENVTEKTKQSRAEAEDVPPPIFPLYCVFAETLPTPTTRANKRQWGIACADLARAGVTPDALRKAIAAYAQLWPQATCTPMAIAKHYDRLALGQTHEQWKLDNDRRRAETERRRRESDAEARRAERTRALTRWANGLGAGDSDARPTGALSGVPGTRTTL